MTCGLNECLTPDNGHRPRRPDAMRLKCGVLSDLADLELQGTPTVEHPSAVTLEPGQDGRRMFRREAVSSGV